MCELMAGGFVPIRVEPEDRNGMRCESGDRIFYPAFDEMKLFGRITGGHKNLLHEFQRSVRTLAILLLAQNLRGTLPRVFHILRSRFRHTFESIEEVEVA